MAARTFLYEGFLNTASPAGKSRRGMFSVSKIEKHIVIANPWLSSVEIPSK